MAAFLLFYCGDVNQCSQIQEKCLPQEAQGHIDVSFVLSDLSSTRHLFHTMCIYALHSSF